MEEDEPRPPEDQPILMPLPGQVADGEGDAPVRVMPQADAIEPQTKKSVKKEAGLARLFERPMEVKQELHAVFEMVQAAGDDNFNDLGRDIPRDTSNRVTTVEDLIEKVNQYSYDVPVYSKCTFWCSTLLSCGSFYLTHKKTVPAGYFGHYQSAGRHMLKPPGQHTLTSTKESWLDDVPADDPENLVREFGIKTLIVVPENHVAGAFHVGSRRGDADADAAGTDGEFVLLGQGRHVLDSSCYRDIVCVKLESDNVKLGPVTVLYIKEGFLGGAYERNTGQFRILQPGPPYLLHEKDYEGIELVRRTLDSFSLGPITFVTVKEGEVAGAYEKATGLYQLLPPGHTYQLHEKDYEGIELVRRTNNFKLGPYTFLTVQKGYVAGAYRRKGGEFVLLDAGASYQLNEDEFEEPCLAKRDQHVVQCGPLTFVTLQEGVLTGAYRTKDGRFEEFEQDGDSSEFVLHERDYHGLTVVSKYSDKVQDFGPNKIITIPEGMCGLFEREGILEVKEPGYYKVSAEYRVKENIPLQVRSERFEKLAFRTKDSVPMKIDFVVVWKIAEPLLVATWPGTLAELTDCLRTKSTAGIVMLLRTFTRSELLPTRQDVLLHKADDEDGGEGTGTDEAIQKAAELSKALISTTEQNSLDMLNTASNEGSWGLKVLGMKIDALELADEQMMNDLQMIAQSQLAKSRKQMESRLEVQNVRVDREAQLQKARAQAEVQKTKAESDAAVELANARAQNEVALQKAKAEAEVQRTRAESDAAVELANAKAQNEVALAKATMEAKAQAELERSRAESVAAVEVENAKKQKEIALATAEAKRIELEMDKERAESLAAIEETKMKTKQREAELEAARIRALSEAEWDRGCKEQEVLSKMPPQELELKKLDKIVEGMKYYGEALGKAAWRHPDEMYNFMEEMKPYLRIQAQGLTAEQLMVMQGRGREAPLPPPAPPPPLKSKSDAERDANKNQVD